jgi:hypothetical protein
MPDTMQQSPYGLAPSMAYGDTSAFPNVQVPNEAFPTLQHNGSDMSQMAPPAINIDFAPSNSKLGGYGPSKQQIDQDSLTPPERGKRSFYFNSQTSALELVELTVLLFPHHRPPKKSSARRYRSIQHFRTPFRKTQSWTKSIAFSWFGFGQPWRRLPILVPA